MLVEENLKTLIGMNHLTYVAFNKNKACSKILKSFTKACCLQKKCLENIISKTLKGITKVLTYRNQY